MGLRTSTKPGQGRPAARGGRLPGSATDRPHDGSRTTLSDGTACVIRCRGLDLPLLRRRPGKPTTGLRGGPALDISGQQARHDFLRRGATRLAVERFRSRAHPARDPAFARGPLSPPGPHRATSRPRRVRRAAGREGNWGSATTTVRPTCFASPAAGGAPAHRRFASVAHNRPNARPRGHRLASIRERALSSQRPAPLDSARSGLHHDGPRARSVPGGPRHSCQGIQVNVADTIGA